MGDWYPQSFNSWPFIKSHHLRIMAEFPRVNKIQSRRNRNRNNTFRKERKVDYCAFQCAHVSYHSDGGLLSKQVFQNCVGVGVAPISFLSVHSRVTTNHRRWIFPTHRHTCRRTLRVTGRCFRCFVKETFHWKFIARAPESCKYLPSLHPFPHPPFKIAFEGGLFSAAVNGFITASSFAKEIRQLMVN